MGKKQTIKFIINQLLIDGELDYECSIFDCINDDETENYDIKDEMISVKRIHKETHESRFITLYFRGGDKYPYPSVVMDERLNEKDNPRSPEQIELDKLLFVLIDTEKKLIYLSNQQRKIEVKDWLAAKLKKDVVIKAIISEEEFTQRLNSIKEISYSIVPDLINRLDENTLSNHLKDDPLGYCAKYASLKFVFNDTRLNDKYRNNLAKLIRQKRNFKMMTVIGRDDNDMEMLMNMSEIANRVMVTVRCGKDLMPDPDRVFGTLMTDIKKSYVS